MMVTDWFNAGRYQMYTKWYKCSVGKITSRIQVQVKKTAPNQNGNTLFQNSNTQTNQNSDTKTVTNQNGNMLKR